MKKKAQDEYDDFYEDVYSELAKYGDIDELHVCDNICDHLSGNVYVKYFRETDADKALKTLTGRFYGGRPVVAEFSPVTDFREASCRQYENRECTRGGHCNFMHLKQITRELHKYLFSQKNHKKAEANHQKGNEREIPKEEVGLVHLEEIGPLEEIRKGGNEVLLGAGVEVLEEGNLGVKERNLLMRGNLTFNLNQFLLRLNPLTCNSVGALISNLG